MRPMQDLGELLTESDRLDESIAVYERMLGLNPGDNHRTEFRRQSGDTLRAARFVPGRLAGRTGR
jgi:hypothetical protein